MYIHIQLLKRTCVSTYAVHYADTHLVYFIDFLIPVFVVQVWSSLELKDFFFSFPCHYMDPAEFLPPEIIETILLHLNLPSVTRLSQCSWNWYDAVNLSEPLWKNLCRVHRIESRQNRITTWKVMSTVHEREGMSTLTKAGSGQGSGREVRRLCWWIISSLHRPLLLLLS